MYRAGPLNMDKDNCNYTIMLWSFWSSPVLFPVVDFGHPICGFCSSSHQQNMFFSSAEYVLPIGRIRSSHRRNMFFPSAEYDLPIGGIWSSHQRNMFFPSAEQPSYWPKLVQQLLLIFLHSLSSGQSWSKVFAVYSFKFVLWLQWLVVRPQFHDLAKFRLETEKKTHLREVHGVVTIK